VTNAAFILRYRSVAVPALHDERIRRTFSLTPELPLRTFCEQPTAVQNVLRLVLDGKLHIDWSEPLCLDSRISSMPIGRQVWPFSNIGFSGSRVSLHALRTGQHVKIGVATFRILQRLPDARWQLQNVVTGEWCMFDESDLLDEFCRNELSFWGRRLASAGARGRRVAPLAGGCGNQVAAGQRLDKALVDLCNRRTLGPAEKVQDDALFRELARHRRLLRFRALLAGDLLVGALLREIPASMRKTVCPRRLVSAVAREIDGFPWRRSGPPWPARPASA
jgi:hypothetical protein